MDDLDGIVDGWKFPRRAAEPQSRGDGHHSGMRPGGDWIVFVFVTRGSGTSIGATRDVRRVVRRPSCIW